jgi:hypothetical protein
VGVHKQPCPCQHAVELEERQLQYREFVAVDHVEFVPEDAQKPEREEHSLPYGAPVVPVEALAVYLMEGVVDYPVLLELSLHAWPPQ